MKITLVIDRIFSDAGGTENQLMKLLRGLSARGHDVELMSFTASPWLSSLAQTSTGFSVSIFDLGGVSRLPFWTGLRAITQHLHARQPDVVHTFFPVANIVGVLAAHRAKVPAIISSRRDYGHWITPRYLKATRFADRFIHGIITNSRQVKDLTVRVEGVPADRITVIPNGIDIEAVRRDGRDMALKRKLGIPDDAIVLGLVANFRPIKRHDTLIDACARLLPQRPNLHLLFVGGDNEAEPARDQVMAHVAKKSLGNHIHSARADGNIGDFLSIIDIGLNCSESEGLSNAVVEYMCAGIPCVISDGGGNRDLVSHEQTGLLYPVGDDERLADCLARMLDDAELRDRCRNTALKMVSSTMGLQSVLERYEAAYCHYLFEARPGCESLAPSRRWKSLAKSVALHGLTHPLSTSIARLAQPRSSTVVMMYHEIGRDDDDCDAWQVVRQEDFRRQVDAIRRRFDLVSLDVALDSMRSRVRSTRPMAVLTFDDGHAGNFEHLLPIVEANAVPVTIYVATEHVEQGRSYWFDRIVNMLQGSDVIDLDLSKLGLGRHRFNEHRGASNWARIQSLLQSIKHLPVNRCDDVADLVAQCVARGGRSVLKPMTPQQVSELSRRPLITIGSHSHGHEVMTKLDDDGVRQTLTRSQECLKRWTGRHAVHFAFPGGFHDKRVETIVREEGFVSAMGGGQGLWTPKADPFAIPRLFVGRYDGLERFCFTLDWSGVLDWRQSGASRALSYLAGLGLGHGALSDLS